MGNEAHPIPFNQPYVTGPEYAYVADAVHRGHISGDGHYTAACHEILSAVTGTRDILLTTSCTHALEIAALLLEIRPGDEVIMPSFTFVSTANAFVLRGAVPVFVDIRPDTFNIDERLIEAAVTPRTRAIVVVHYAGVGCEMDVISHVAQRYGIAIVEDNAHGLGGSYRNQKLGTFGVLATQSFHETKNIQCGEGGALLINDPALASRAEIIREKGTNRSQFFRGAVDKYTWVDVGSSYLPSDMLAAFLFAQLEEFPRIQAMREKVWRAYDVELRAWSNANDVMLPQIPDYCEHPSHLFAVLLPSLEIRQRLISHLAELDVQAVFHYVPLHSSPMGKSIGRAFDCPVTEDVSQRLLRLPLFPGLAEGDVDRVVAAVTSFEA